MKFNIKYFQVKFNVSQIRMVVSFAATNISNLVVSLTWMSSKCFLYTISEIVDTSDPVSKRKLIRIPFNFTDAVGHLEDILLTRSCLSTVESVWWHSRSPVWLSTERAGLLGLYIPFVSLTVCLDTHFSYVLLLHNQNTLSQISFLCFDLDL